MVGMSVSKRTGEQSAGDHSQAFTPFCNPVCGVVSTFLFISSQNLATVVHRYIRILIIFILNYARS